MEFYIEAKLKKDYYNSHYTTGLTFYDSETTRNLKEIAKTETETLYEGLRGVKATLHHEARGEATLFWTSLTAGESPETLEMISSVAIRGVKADKVHRLRSWWSAEGRLVTQKVTDLGLEASWCDNGVRVEKFGTRGSLPVREYFPFVALEDSATGTFTAIMLYAPSTWQIELICQHREKGLVLMGGLGDADFGHWQKTIAPGETFTTNRALVATGKSLLEVCQKLVKAQTPDISPVDDHMGIMFNEYCTTWGNPKDENIRAIADRLEGKGIQYLVIDCGWYARGHGWWDSIGDWEPSPEIFPNGVKATCDYIRSKGMIPGIWFEMENTGRNAKAFHFEDHLLHRDGEVLTVENRRFWDMADPWVVDYLSEKVIKFLKENGFGYLKIDYNESIGIGADGYESLGEGLRKRIEGSQNFIQKIKEGVPGIVIENCASGGHRLEPSMMEIMSQASFSDAHECPSIPVIAANLHRAVRPDQSQIWAVIQKDDSLNRVYYSVINTFLGRMCLSGDIHLLSDEQWDIVDRGMDFYRKCAPIIKYGTTTLIHQVAEEYENLKGEQMVIREYDGRALVVAHRFADSREISLGTLDGWRLVEEFGSLSGDFTAWAGIYEK